MLDPGGLPGTVRLVQAVHVKLAEADLVIDVGKEAVELNLNQVEASQEIVEKLTSVVRNIAKVFSVEETSFAEDMSELDKKQLKSEVDRGMQADDKETVALHDAQPTCDDGPAAKTRLKPRCKLCCCFSPC